jgi:hypothetical protein
VPAMAVEQEPPRSLRAEAICSPGAVMVGTHTAVDRRAAAAEAGDGVDIADAIVAAAGHDDQVLALFGRGQRVGAGARVAGREDLDEGSMAAVSKLPSSTVMSWVRSEAW